jgi:hypothetical protein
LIAHAPLSSKLRRQAAVCWVTARDQLSAFSFPQKRTLHSLGPAEREFKLKAER